MIVKRLKKHNLKTKEFIEFAKLSKTQFNYAVKKNDDIYMKGLEIKLMEFIKWKIKQLKSIKND
jgi:hypothetical protein